MNLQRLASHTVDLDLLPEAPRVLDVGCRDFAFTRAVLEVRPNATIIALDPDQNVALEKKHKELMPGIGNVLFVRIALVGDLRTTAKYSSFSTGEANHLLERGQQPKPGSDVYEVTCCRITDIGHGQHFDLVKLDCEGSEFGILETWPGPIATQISVEFHDGLMPGLYDDGYFERLFMGPLKQYHVVSSEVTELGPDRIKGRWDSLLVLKGAK